MSSYAPKLLSACTRSSRAAPKLVRTPPPILAASRPRTDVLQLRSRPSPRTRRDYATSRFEASNERPSGFQPRVSHLFIGLAVLGLFVTTYGLLEWYFSFDQWPQEVRDDLRKAIKARNRGDVMRAEASFRDALRNAHAVPLAKLGDDPLLKITGIHISLAALLESVGQHRKSLEVLQGALDLMDRYDPEPTSKAQDTFGASRPSGRPQGEHAWDSQDVTRQIGLLQKLGSLCLYLADAQPSRADAYLRTSEVYLNRALNAMVKLGASTSASPAKSNKDGTKLVGRDFNFPAESTSASGEQDLTAGLNGKNESLDRVTKRSMGVAMENLADVYTRQGKHEFAQPLLVQAISTLLPTPDFTKNPTPAKPSVQDTCQAAMLMNTLSSSLLNPPTQAQIKASRAWSTRSVQLSEEALSRPPSSDKTAVGSRGLCNQARVVGEFNLGALAEMDADIPSAIKHFTRSQHYARDIGFQQGVQEAGEALRRLSGLGGGKS